MLDNSMSDYSLLDGPEVSMHLFHPRPEYGPADKQTSAIDVLIPVEKEIVVGGCFHMSKKSAPNVLFFHGNGEIVADYNELEPLYSRMGINFLPVDYRGYGRSTGRPSVLTMMMDCHKIFEFVKGWLEDNGYTGTFIVMGRSLGSASALELASHHKDLIDGLVVESGFAHTGPLLELLGLNTSAMGFSEDKGFLNLEKIKTWHKPTLIIHAELDHLIPITEGQALYDVCPSPDKTLLKIPGANHNDILMRGLEAYMNAVKSLSEKRG